MKVRLERRRILELTAFLGVSVYPCLRLLDFHVLHYEGLFHTAVIGLFGRAERHFAMPISLNAGGLIGIFYPAFYGHLFYPLVGIFAALLSAPIAVRLLALLLVAYQIFLAWQLFRALLADRWLGLGFAAITVWSSYPLVDLYSRGDLPEFFATGMVLAALLSLCLYFHEIVHRRRAHLWLSAAIISITIAAGTHPITAVQGTIFLAMAAAYLVWIFGLPIGSLKNFTSDRLILIQIALAILCVSPWTFFAGKFGFDTLVARTTFSSLIYNSDIDDIWVRLSPIPVDLRTLIETPRNIPAPFIYGQINVALAVLAAAVIFVACKNLPSAWAERAKIAAAMVIPVALFASYLAISLPLGLDRYLPRALAVTQFAYRYVAYVNLALLLCVIGPLCVRRAAFRDSIAIRNTAWVSVTLAAIAVFIHVSNPLLGERNMTPTKTPMFWGNDVARYGGYGKGDNSPERYAQVIERLKEALNTGALFPAWIYFAVLSHPVLPNTDRPAISVNLPTFSGRYGPPVSVPACSAGGGILTNVVAFPWNGLIIDGVLARNEQLMIWSGLSVVRCDRPMSKISFVDLTPTWFRAWMQTARIALFAWALALLTAVLMFWLESRRYAKPS